MADLPPGHTMYVICGVYTKAMVSATGSPNCDTTVYCVCTKSSRVLADDPYQNRVCSFAFFLSSFPTQFLSPFPHFPTLFAPVYQ